jgi:response regulator RpfG family c-di-GMP phosphodiesterase
MSDPQTANKHKRYILVIDADVDDRFHTCMLLQRLGYNIFTAQSVDEVIEFMTVAPPAAVVSDAGPNGSALLTRLSPDTRFFDIPLILLEKHPDADIERRARHKKFAACLKKPVDVNELYGIIQTLVERGPRQNLRIVTHLSASLGSKPNRIEGHATVLSEYGMFFRTLEPLPINTHIPAVIELKGKLINVEALVLYSMSFDEGPFKEPGMGMKFVKISRADRDVIAAFMIEQIEEGIVRL